jgi:hypothetical protein
VVVEVAPDVTAPVIVPRTEAIVLWPPNHKYHTIRPSDLFHVTDACETRITALAVESDEVAEGSGDGSTSDDAVILCPDTVKLRAERQGGGNGRVYRIAYKATDGAGNSATTQIKVHVPRTRADGAAIDGPGPGYAVNAVCDEGEPGMRVMAAPLGRVTSARDLDNVASSVGLTVRQGKNSEISASFVFERPARARLDIYDVSGRMVHSIEANYEAGPQSVYWNGVSKTGTRAPSGIYLFRLIADGTVYTARTALIR